jgi:hypothetical protein
LFTIQASWMGSDIREDKFGHSLTALGFQPIQR